MLRADLLRQYGECTFDVSSQIISTIFALIIIMQGDDPPFLSVGTEVSAKYKGAFCEAKVRKVVKSIKCKVSEL